MRVAGRALRVLAGAVLAWCVALAVLAPEVPRLAGAAAAAIAAATLWNPGAGLILTAALTPAGTLFAAAPARAAEIFAWAFLAAWLLAIRSKGPGRATEAQRHREGLGDFRHDLLGVWRPISRAPLPRTVMIPAALYGAALLASWLMLSLGPAAGVSPLALPQFLLHSIPLDHLIFSSPEPETWTLLQTTTGVAMLLASMATIATDARLDRYTAPNADFELVANPYSGPRRAERAKKILPNQPRAIFTGISSMASPWLVRALAWALVLSIGVLAAATLVDVVMQWSEVNYEGWFILRYVRGERFSLHLADLNAAGSLYVLAGTIAAAFVVLDPRRRGIAIVVLLVIVPALWLTGSRTSLVAMGAGLLILGMAQRGRLMTRPQLAAAGVLMSLLVIAGAATVDWQSDVPGSAARSASLRSQFMQTSGRMFASAPVFGVGIGRYFDRSAEFMPADVRALYGNENAHNYFAQQFAELGVVGGALFLWLAGALVATGWSVVRTSGGDAAPVGVFAAVGAYLLTCLTGHPLLVPEATLPFWVAAGALTGRVDRGERRWTTARHMLAAVAGLVLAAGVAREAVVYARATVAPPEYGFHGQETAADGSAFRWMTRHGVTYVSNDMGFVRLRLHAPDLQMTRPLVIETAIAGVVVDRREIPLGRWVSYDIPSRRSPTAFFRRVDLRANQWWIQDVPLGTRQARRPITVMVAEIRWIPLDNSAR
ncbi:MAG: O-antigen ligase family protein [Vicinamibacterales bacterium]